jgi:hopanoid biosynthesis associated RND transporter like protein HpnN
MVGAFNPISVAFAVLFIGLGADFAIQFSVRYREERLLAPDPADALANTAHHVGPQILVAGTAVAAGFLAFVPTDFAGVAELGLIAGVGMLVAFGCTITFLPAAITVMRPRAERAEVGFASLGFVERRVIRPGSLWVRVVFLALGMFGAVQVPSIAFDSDPLHTKNPNTEAMRTLADLMDSPLTNPYSADVIAPDQAAADALAVRLAKLPLVAQTLTLSSFVPTDQDKKLPLIADAASVLASTLQPGSAAAPVTAEAVRQSAHGALASLDAAAAKLPADDPLRAIAGDLRRLADPATPDSTVLAANAALTRFLPDTLAQLRTALSAQPVTIADVPEDIARDWRLPDGRARVQAPAKAAARGASGLGEFAAQVRAVAPNAVGSALTIVGTADTIVGAFKTAALYAIVAIAVILALVLRRVMDVLLVLLPLFLSAMLTVIVVVQLPLPLNFANIIALPLLLGVGVSFNVYFVMNWRAGATGYLGTATARAVIFSALTTATAFGSLALSGHPGTASMGDLLLVSLGSTLLVSLMFMPALLLSLRLQPSTRG